VRLHLDVDTTLSMECHAGKRTLNKKECGGTKLHGYGFECKNNEFTPARTNFFLLNSTSPPLEGVGGR